MLSRLDRTFSEQLPEIGLDMNSFDYAAYSHMHFDHVGVANEVNGATLIIQKKEYDAAFADEVTVPGFDPTLYNDLKDAGRILIEGDLYHFAISRQDRRVPKFNVDRDLTLASMDRVEALVEETGAAFWIEHELAFFEQLNKAPAYYD